MPATKKTPSEVYQIKVTLEGSNPPIWRRILVEPEMSLAKLHLVLQVVMGWENSHMHDFRSGKQRYGKPQLESGYDEFPMLDEKKVTLKQAFPKLRSKLSYTYDFGDSWEHLIVLEKKVPAERGMKYPAVIDGKRKCPPEDCGGIPGYYLLLETISDPNHPDFEDMLAWVGEGFDPEDFSVSEANAYLHGGWVRRR